MPILFGIIILLCLLMNMCYYEYYHSEHNPLNTMHSYTTSLSHHLVELQ